MRHAEILNACSDLLEARGARPVIRANADLDLTGIPGAQTLCPECRHPTAEHGATGECWNPSGVSCPCAALLMSTRPTCLPGSAA